MINFDPSTSSIHAYLCADGYVISNPKSQKHKYYHIALRNTNMTLLMDFKLKLEHSFRLKAHITKDGRCRVQDKNLYYFLTKDHSYYSNQWILPRLSKQNLRYWLQSFFDCEAWVSLEPRKTRLIGLDSINYHGIKQIKDSLERFGINSKLKSVKNGKIFRLYIYGRGNLQIFKKEIGFLHPEKKRKMERALDSYVSYIWVFPKNRRMLKAFLYEFVKSRSTIDKSFRIRICSKVRNNLALLSSHLKNVFGVESKLNGPYFNGAQKKYYELVIHKRSEVAKCQRIFFA